MSERRKSGTPPVADASAARVFRVMDEVRRNLDGEHTLETLAKRAHFSAFHFHRVFKRVAGETLTAFVQRARLERAAYLMMAAPTRSLTSIAHEVGFSASSDFTRVFRRHFSVAPSKWDRRSRLTPNSPQSGIEEGYEATVAEARRQAGKLEVIVRDVAAAEFITVRCRTPFVGKPLEEGYATLTRWLERRGWDWREAELCGWSWDNYETTPLDLVTFDFGFRFDGLEPLGPDEPVRLQRFPAHREAAVVVDGALVQIAVAWDFLYDEWLPSSALEPDDLPGIKRFDKRPDELGWDRYNLRCCLPVRPRRG